ncbi:MAG TPA: SDR family NAD(P)-dependent oxidoreductase [Clostridia bacterium]|nr:SDR family NAD(P)-dependent oxidoreductase [Clostridia bacterium]
MSRNIVITGAGRGLGYSITQKHVDMDDKVYALTRQMTDELEKLAGLSKNLKVLICDIGSTPSVEAAAREILSEGRQIDILYNVAAVYNHEDKVGLAETDLDACMQMYGINAVGALRVCKALLPLIQKGSLVANISSEAGSIGAARRKQEYSYCMSKAALNMGTKLLSNELWDCSARVIAIHPGWVRTRMGGPESFKSKYSVSPEESADGIINIALNIGSIPQDRMFMQYNGEIIQW